MHLIKFIWWNLALYLLTLALIDQYVNGYDVLAEHKDVDIDHHHDHHIETHTSTHHHHMDQSTLVFFTLKDLKLGKSMPIYLRGTNPSSSSPKFLPREEVEIIPFKLSKLPYLLDYFGFPRGSSQSKAMEDTLRECEAKPIKGETKFCATSLESMLNFVHETLGTTPKVLSTQQNDIFANVLRNYTIADDPKEVPAQKSVACHTMPYPYVIYYCHYQESPTKVFQVSLKAEKNEVVQAVAVCHMDTSQWSEEHVSFKLLGIKPGTLPVCHFFPADNLVWVPLSVTSPAEGFLE